MIYRWFYNQARMIVVSFVFLVAGSGSVSTQDTSLQSLDTWGLSRGWEGVGLLNIEGRKSCTGVMIQPDLVLTAAHCLYDNETGEFASPQSIEFRAGWRDGHAIARRAGKAALIHPKYVQSTRANGDKIRTDIALLQLADPIQSTHANPFRTDSGIRTGHSVSVVSYGAGRNDSPSRQRSCDVLEAAAGLVVMSCDVVAGSSGSPVFAMREGRPRIVSLVSALGDIRGQQVSYGMDIKKPLAEIMADYRAGKGVYPKQSLGAKRITFGNAANSSTGARFVRP